MNPPSPPPPRNRPLAHRRHPPPLPSPRPSRHRNRIRSRSHAGSDSPPLPRLSSIAACHILRQRQRWGIPPRLPIPPLWNSGHRFPTPLDAPIAPFDRPARRHAMLPDRPAEEERSRRHLRATRQLPPRRSGKRGERQKEGLDTPPCKLYRVGCYSTLHTRQRYGERRRGDRPLRWGDAR